MAKYVPGSVQYDLRKIYIMHSNGIKKFRTAYSLLFFNLRALIYCLAFDNCVKQQKTDGGSAASMMFFSVLGLLQIMPTQEFYQKQLFDQLDPTTKMTGDASVVYQWPDGFIDFCMLKVISDKKEQDKIGAYLEEIPRLQNDPEC